MIPVEVKYHRGKEKWVAQANGGANVLALTNTKKSAVRKAQGHAQQEADKYGNSQVVEIYQQDGTYQRKSVVNPSYE